LRIHYGPGYRVYYKDTERELIILLCGGSKSTQEDAIARAQEMAGEPLDDEQTKETEP
jgi:putative addiction module killer protein